MTHEEIQAAIERLRAIEPFDSTGGAVPVAKVVWGFMGGMVSVMDFRDAIIDLLKQADPDTHMELPTGSDGLPIHVGDEVCGLDHPSGGVYCHAIVNPCVIAVGEMFDYANSKGWALWNTLDVRRYRKPTVEDVLREFGDEVRRCCDTEATVTEYAAKLREVMSGE